MSQLIIQGLEEALANERSRLVGLCATLTKRTDIAEDLAQETLFEAWRNIHNLRNPQQFSSWLSGIARNVCLRWKQRQKRVPFQLTSAEQVDYELEAMSDDTMTVEFELERQELVDLLDQALHLLPPMTRELLIARYVEESPLHEIAARLGIQSSTAAMRLQRGKLALQRSLHADLEAEGYHFPGTASWQETKIWCTSCGKHYLLGQFRPDEALLLLNCPNCGIFSRSNFLGTQVEPLFSGLKRVKPAIFRLHHWINGYYRSALDSLSTPCLTCGRDTPLRVLASKDELGNSKFIQQWQGNRGLYQRCSSCQLFNWVSQEVLVLALPEGRQFLQAHPRVYLLPEQQLEVDGQPACLTRFASWTDQSTLEVVSACASLRVLRINGRAQ